MCWDVRSCEAVMSGIFQMEKWLKEKVYGYKTCGQFILTHTKLICPKGLRNGPCRGTLDGKCEVIPKIDCVWANIELKKKEAKSTKNSLPQNDSLLNNASYINLIDEFLTRIRAPGKGHLSIGVPQFEFMEV